MVTSDQPRATMLGRVARWLDVLAPPARQRAMFAVLMQLAGIAMAGFAVWLVWIVAYGDWPPSLAEKRLSIIGAALLFLLGIVASVIGANLLGGPVGRVKMRLPGGSEVEASDDAASTAHHKAAEAE